MALMRFSPFSFMIHIDETILSGKCGCVGWSLLEAS